MRNPMADSGHKPQPPSPLIFSPETVLSRLSPPTHAVQNASSANNSVSMPFIRRHVTRRLETAKSECDKDLRRITNNIKEGDRILVDDPVDPIMTALHDIIAVATEVTDMSVRQLTTQPKICESLVQRIQNIGKAWDEHPDRHGRHSYVQVLLAVASLHRVVEWREAEKQFWNFDDNDDTLEAPLTFITKPADDVIAPTPTVWLPEAEHDGLLRLPAKDDAELELSRPASPTRRSRDEHPVECQRNLEMVLHRVATDPISPPADTLSDLSTSSRATINVPRTASVKNLLGEQPAVPHDPSPVTDGRMCLVDAFLHSQEQRTMLLTQGLSTSDLRDALRSCERHICTSLLAVLGSPNAKRAVVLLEGTRAQAFLDAAQAVLDRGSLSSAKQTSQARRLIIRLSEARNQLPSSLFITGVTDHDEHPTFSGGFGDIYRASFNGGTVALKRIRMFRPGTDSPRSRLQFCREALVWQTLRHEYVLPLIGIDSQTFPSSFCMVSPWMHHGTVLRYLSEHGRANVEKMLLQIAEGLAYLHSMKIVHGDLRGANILVSDDWNACLADFGLTGIIEDTISTTSGALTSTTNRAGSLRWFAPELIVPTSFGCDRFVRTTASDVYAFACVCVELHTGRPPFSDVPSEPAIIFKVVVGERPPRPAAISDNLWELVTAAWAQNYLNRPSIEKIVESMTM